MPEHRAGTPPHLRDLESFLWHDFETKSDGWIAWVRGRMPAVADLTTENTVDDAMQLHRLLRALQATNNGITAGDETVRSETLDRLVKIYGIRPYLGAGGLLRLVSGRAGDPIALLMITALESMQSDAWRRFKLCREPTCRASYYDLSKASGKTWCSMETCGSRNKMRRYRSEM